jgi:hypothetical protein
VQHHARTHARTHVQAGHRIKNRNRGRTPRDTEGDCTPTTIIPMQLSAQGNPTTVRGISHPPPPHPHPGLAHSTTPGEKKEEKHRPHTASHTKGTRGPETHLYCATASSSTASTSSTCSAVSRDDKGKAVSVTLVLHSGKVTRSKKKQTGMDEARRHAPQSRTGCAAVSE